MKPMREDPREDPRLIECILDKIKLDQYMFNNLKDPLTENNWSNWKRRMILILDVCELWEYANGNIPKPDNTTDPNTSGDPNFVPIRLNSSS
jgi:hypothetical protein